MASRAALELWKRFDAGASEGCYDVPKERGVIVNKHNRRRHFNYPP
jgi:hypothetical protein